MKKLLLLAMPFLLIANFASAQNVGPVSFANIAQKQVITVDSNGNEAVELTDVGVMVPGDTVIYTSTFTNIGGQTVSNIVVNNPIPTNTKYVIFSAQGANTLVSFSIDGGATYAAPADLTVTEASGVSRAAKPEEYTDIRWVYEADLAATESSSVNFKVVIL